MSITTELAALLIAEGFATARGTDVFTNMMPETPDTCVMVFRSGGLSPQGGFSVDGIFHERPGVQVRVRGGAFDDDTPETAIDAIFNLFMKQFGETLSGTKYLSLIPSQPPFVLERDKRNRTVWAFNATSEKELSA